MVSIGTDPTWLLYDGNREDFRRGDMESNFEDFGSEKGYGNVIDFLIATDELLELITDVVQNSNITLNDRCTNLILVLIDIIVNDIVYGSGSGRVHQKLRANGVDEHSAAAFCSPQNNLVKSIQHWVKLYDKLESGTFVAMTKRTTRRTYRHVSNTSRKNMGYMVASIVALIAIIPTIAALANMVNHAPLLESGRTLSSYSGYLTADTRTTFDVDDIEQFDRNKNAMLAYFSVLTDSSPGSYQFGMHGVDGPGTGSVGMLDDYKAKIGVKAGLHRPSDQAMLSIARGSLLEGAKLISLHGNNYYVMTLEKYASQSTMRIVDLFHEHLRVDVSDKIGEYIRANIGNTGDGQTCQLHNEMLGNVKEFVDKRTDAFATLDSVMLSYMDATVEIFDRFDHVDAPILTIIKGVNTCNIDKFNQGLSRLFIQYTGYIYSNINSIRDSLITIEDDKYGRIRSAAVGSRYIKEEKVGPIKKFLQRNILPSVSYLIALNLHGEDSPVTEYRKWQVSFYDAPLPTVAASLLNGGVIAAGAGGLFGANMLGAGGVAGLVATGIRLGASFWN
tara:strand:- start:171 stop:1850 length:1680 start_codon:yes stop_codon:yes gene_type:complete